MKYTYAYKTSDGVRHEDVVDAPSREVVFATLRGRGIKPIKVIAADGSKANGEQRRGALGRITVIIVLVVAGTVGAVSYIVGTKMSVGEPKRQSKMCVATPLARQVIPGSRSRIENLPADLFANGAERFLAFHAEPGRRVPDGKVLIPPDEIFVASLSNDILYAEDEYSEYVDLKRIVVKMKSELRNYLIGGGTVGGYVQALKDRQKIECEQRDNAENRLLELSKTSDESAYAYWLKANARLQSMGIYPLSLPEPLRTYQSKLEQPDE